MSENGASVSSQAVNPPVRSRAFSLRRSDDTPLPGESRKAFRDRKIEERVRAEHAANTKIAKEAKAKKDKEGRKVLIARAVAVVLAGAALWTYMSGHNARNTSYSFGDAATAATAVAPAGSVQKEVKAPELPEGINDWWKEEMRKRNPDGQQPKPPAP